MVRRARGGQAVIVGTKNGWDCYEVFDITYDSNGYPLFLIYDRNKGEWVRESAKSFYPVSDEGLRFVRDSGWL